MDECKALPFAALVLGLRFAAVAGPLIPLLVVGATVVAAAA